MPVDNEFLYSEMFTGFICYNHFENLHGAKVENKINGKARTADTSLCKLTN